MTTADYQVRLDAFHGPLDLLLFLIRKNEVDVHDIPIASITDQFLRFIDNPDPRTGLATLDVDAAGEFLVMAATLVEIKSRMLAPGPTSAAGEDAGGPGGAGGAGDDPRRRSHERGEDPRAELVRQLLAYKKFRDAASELDARHRLWSDRHPAAAAGLGAGAADAEAEAARLEAPADVELDDLHIVDLVDAFARIMATVDLSRVGEHHVQDDETPIELHQTDILDTLARSPRLALRAVFEGRTKPEAIGLFLALLELIRQRRVALSREANGDLSLAATGEAVGGLGGAAGRAEAPESVTPAT